VLSAGIFELLLRLAFCHFPLVKSNKRSCLGAIYVTPQDLMVRLESIGAVSRKLASVSRTNPDINVSEDCPEAEQLYPHSPDSLD